MPQTVLLGDPACFRIKSGANPHTRDAWGRRKRVDLRRAIDQWTRFKSLLEQQGVAVRVIPSSEEWPGLVFPANAGFRFGNRFYLSRLHPGRAGEADAYRRAVSALGLTVLDFPADLPFEGEADFFPVGGSGSGPARYLFTSGRLERRRWTPRLGWPPVRRVYGFRSDPRALETLRQIVHPAEVIPLELVDESHYHGDTVLCPFGPNREFLMAALEGLSKRSQMALRGRFGNRLIPLDEPDARRFAANSFQITVPADGETRRVLLMPDGLTQGLYRQVRQRGVIPCPVDVSEFLEKGGGAVKCMLLDLGELPV